MHPSYVPKTIPYSGIPLPSTGSRPMSVPPLQRYYQNATTSCLPSRRTSFPSLGGTTVASSVRSNVARDAKATGLGTSAYSRASHNRPLMPWKRQDLPSSCGTPITCLHVFSDSGRTGSRLANNVADGMAPAKETTRASATRLSELNRTASRLAVYASQPGLPRHHARLASGGWLNFFRVGFPPTGSR